MTNKALITVEQFQDLLKKEHPFAELLGMQIKDIGHGTSKLFLPNNPEHTRLGGIVAGPMIMALCDMALYAAVVGATGEARAVTASLNINFLRGAPPGGVRAEAKILKVGRITAGEVYVYPENGDEILSHAISNWGLPRNK